MQLLRLVSGSGVFLSPKTQDRLVNLLGTLITLLSLAWAADLHRRLGFVLYTEQFLTTILGLSIGVCYLSISAKRLKNQGVLWYDLLAATAALIIGMYLAINYASLVNELSYRPTHLVIVGTLLVVLSVEGLRRLVGWALTLVICLFIAYGLFGQFVPGELSSRPISFTRLAVYLGLDSNAMLGLPLIVGATIVIPFIFFGQVLARSGGSDFFTDLAVSLMGRFRGGSAKIAVFASALFGAISGSAVSNVATTGVITIPLMSKSGYSARVAAAIEAVASTGGQLMPPIMGAAAFLMAEFLEVPYADIVTAAAFPALLYFLTLFLQVDLEAAKQGITRIDEKDIKPTIKVLMSGWHFPIPFIVLIVALFNFNLSPSASALLATVVLLFTSILFGYHGKKISFTDLWQILARTGRSVIDLILICAGAGIVIGILNLSGLGFGLTLSLVSLGGASLGVLLILAAVISIILGMGMPTVGVYVLLATLVAPALVEIGVEPIAAHLFVLYFGMMSMITPPVALAAFAGASIAGSEPMRTGVTAIRFAWSAYIVPFLFVMSPSLLLIGETSDIVRATIPAIAGIWLVTASIVGYLLRPLKPLPRALVFLSGVALLLPMNSHPLAYQVVIAGGISGVCLIVVGCFQTKITTDSGHAN